MSILFVLLMFLLIISARYLIEPKSEVVVIEPEIVAKPQAPRLKREFGFEIPDGYCFHLGHTWVAKEGANDARVGVDTFVTNLMGKIDRVAVRGADRWVRQGQKLITLSSDGTTVDLLSPVEGVVVAVNDDVLKDPSLLASDPYQNGWIAMVKSADLKVNQRNLIQGSMVAPWMQNSVARLSAMVAPSPALAQDGGTPINGLLPQLTPELRKKVVTEFFLS